MQQIDSFVDGSQEQCGIEKEEKKGEISILYLHRQIYKGVLEINLKLFNN